MRHNRLAWINRCLPNQAPMGPKGRIIVGAAACALVLLAGCAATGKPLAHSAPAGVQDSAGRPLEAIEVPRRIGLVENVGLQIPAVSPDGEQVLYLRTDQTRLMPMTLLGSPDPQDTPPEGTLSIWIRPVTGAMPGRPLSSERWAHSPAWSDSGRAVAYVVNEPPGSYLVHVDMASRQQTVLGSPGVINCMPRFDGDDRTLIFCAGQAVAGPMQVYRQMVGQPQPTPLSPDGADCLCPTITRGGTVLCVQVEGDHLNWAWCSADGTKVVATQWGLSGRLELLQAWAGIATPVSPDRDGVLFYDVAQDRICILQASEKALRRHRPRGIAACWLDGRTIALATPDGAFVTDTRTGVSTSLFSGQWIPCRYVPDSRRLILLGQQGVGRFAIWEVTTRSGSDTGKTVQAGAR